MTISALSAFIRLGTVLRCSAAAFLLLLSSQEVSGQESGRVSLNRVTVMDRVNWLFQEMLAPGILKDEVPLYAYQIDDALKVLGRAEAVGTMVDLDWHVGTAVRFRDLWHAFPVPARETPLSDVAGRLESQGKQLAESAEFLRALGWGIEDSPFVVCRVEGRRAGR